MCFTKTTQSRSLADTNLYSLSLHRCPNQLGNRRMSCPPPCWCICVCCRTRRCLSGTRLRLITQNNKTTYSVGRHTKHLIVEQTEPVHVYAEENRPKTDQCTGRNEPSQSFAPALAHPVEQSAHLLPPAEFMHLRST